MIFSNLQSRSMSSKPGRKDNEVPRRHHTSPPSHLLAYASALHAGASNHPAPGGEGFHLPDPPMVVGGMSPPRPTSALLLTQE